MTRWRRTIRVKQHLDPGRPFAEVRDAVAATLRADRAYGKRAGAALDYDFVEIVDELAGAESVGELDAWLDELYDWADANRVWVG